MRAGGGKQKGNSFERQVANFLSERFAGYTGVPKSFQRKPDSGSYFGGSNESRVATHVIDHQTFGDILCPKNFLWTIECKAYKTPFSLNSILQQKNTLIEEWLAQAEQDAHHAGKIPLLIVKFNNCEIFVLSKYSGPNVRFIYKDYQAYLLKDFFDRADSSFFAQTEG